MKYDKKIIPHEINSSVERFFIYQCVALPYSVWQIALGEDDTEGILSQKTSLCYWVGVGCSLGNFWSSIMLSLCLYQCSVMMKLEHNWNRTGCSVLGFVAPLPLLTKILRGQGVNIPWRRWEKRCLKIFPLFIIYETRWIKVLRGKTQSTLCQQIKSQWP